MAHIDESQIKPEKTLFDVLRDLWRARLAMVCGAIVMLCFAVMFMLSARPYYEASIIVAPALHIGKGLDVSTQRPEGTLQSDAGRHQTSDAFLRFAHIYKGGAVAQGLAHDAELLNSMAQDQPFFFSAAPNTATHRDIAAYLERHVTLEPLSGTHLRTLSYRHPDPAFATKLVQRLHHIADRQIRLRLLDAVTERISYLNQALAETQNPEHRRTLTQLLMEQERLKMLVSLYQPYAASIVEPAEASARPVWPDPYLVYPVFVFIGLFLGFVISGMRRHG